MKFPMWIAAVCLALSGAAFAQMEGDEAQDEGEAQQESTQETQREDAHATETVVTDAHRAVWTLMAQVAAKAGELPEDKTAELVELYVEARARYADAEDATRDEWRAEMRAKLESQRAQGEVRGEIFDTTYLEQVIKVLINRHRKQFAEALVKLLDKDVAEKVYPLLGGFDKRTDGLVNMIMGYELADEAEVSAATAIQQYYIETVKASTQPIEQMGPAMHAAQQKFITDMEPLLSREQLQKVARKAGVQLES